MLTVPYLGQIVFIWHFAGMNLLRETPALPPPFFSLLIRVDLDDLDVCGRSDLP